MSTLAISSKLPGWNCLTQQGLELDNRPGLKGAELAEALQQADAAICRSQPKITADLLENPGKLKAIARAGVGVDTIDVAAATRKGIVVMNTPGGNTVSAAEHTIALMFAMSRNIPAADATMKAGGWDRNKFVGSQLAGKTLGVIGLGRIGLEVARRAFGLDMKVLGFDPFVTSARTLELGIEPAANLEALLPNVDYLTIHIPLTPETAGFISTKQLQMMRKTARVLNVARGGVIDETALSEALEAGTIAGAGIDVYNIEPLAEDSPLRLAPNIVLTPHLGASTLEAQHNVAVEAAQLIADFLLRGVVANAVNMAALDRSELDAIRQYVDLARRLGLLHAQLAQGPIQQATLVYRGELAKKKTKLLTAAFTAGMLEHALSDGINLVNAEVTARERGIEITESTSPKKGDFASAMSTEVTTDSGAQTIVGTLFGDQYQRLVQIGNYRMECYLDGTMLIFHHLDAPGLIGHVGTLLGRHNVNIAGMNVGRAGNKPGGQAVGVLNLDGIPPEEALNEMRSHPHIESVTVVKLPAAGEMPSWLG